MVFYDTGLPRPDGGYGYVKVEGLFNLGDGAIHASGGNGSLYRIDPDTGEATYLGTPIQDQPSRLTQLVKHHDGFAYGITGRNGHCKLLRFDLKTDKWQLSNRILDDQGDPMWQCHDLAITPEGTVYAGENDHPRRSAHLWEILDVTKEFD